MNEYFLFPTDFFRLCNIQSFFHYFICYTRWKKLMNKSENLEINHGQKEEVKINKKRRQKNLGLERTRASKVRIVLLDEETNSEQPKSTTTNNSEGNPSKGKALEYSNRQPSYLETRPRSQVNRLHFQSTCHKSVIKDSPATLYLSFRKFKHNYKEI